MPFELSVIWIGLDLENWTHVQLWAIVILLRTETLIKTRNAFYATRYGICPIAALCFAFNVLSLTLSCVVGQEYKFYDSVILSPFWVNVFHIGGPL